MKIWKALLCAKFFSYYYLLFFVYKTLDYKSGLCYFIFFLLFTMNKDLIFFGMQWSWKWTQAKLLIEELKNYVQFEPWQVYRALCSNNNSIGNYVKKRTNTGNLVEDNVTISIYEAYYQTLEADQLMLLDWFPRKMQQMYYFLEKEYRYNRDFLAVYFDISREVAVQRLLERSKLEWRADDTLDAINIRIETYLKETLPVVKTFENLWKIITVNVNDTIENIYSNLIQKVKNHAK